LSDKDIFSNNDTSDKDVDKVINVFADKLMSITKEDGTPKYDSLEKALDALKASQEHIPTLENDNKSLRDQIAELTERANKAKELEEIVKRMTTGNTEPEKPEGNNKPDGGGLTEKDAAELVKRLLNEEKQTTVAVQNVKDVNNKLVAKFGDKASEVIQAKAKELGTTPAQLKELSATNPAMVLALFGGASSSPAPTSSSIRTDGLKPLQTELKRPEKSILGGIAATDKNQLDFMLKIKEEVYKRNNVT
jgi:DNA repair exonuclease SbcCD ATPase subunit